MANVATEYEACESTNSTPNVRLKTAFRFGSSEMHSGVVRLEAPKNVMLTIGHFGPLVWCLGTHSYQFFLAHYALGNPKVNSAK